MMRKSLIGVFPKKGVVNKFGGAFFGKAAGSWIGSKRDAPFRDFCFLFCEKKKLFVSFSLLAFSRGRLPLVAPRCGLLSRRP